jgi:dTDP-4-amino-4,6-dideoxygalactose transaminase
VDLAAQQAEVDDEVRAGIDEVFATTAFVGGPAVGRFEAAYAAAVGVQHCVGVANGTDALELALRAVGVGPGDEVVLPANTFVATAEAASRIGAVPVPVDVDPVHLLVDPDAVRSAVGPRTGAVVPVHLFGRMAPVEELLKIAADAGVPLVEDAAQAQGARRRGRCAGAVGLAAGTSFYPGKNLGAAGDAGGVTTDDADVARRVRLLAGHGSARKYDHEVVGMNSRLDTVQAVVLEAKLKRLAGWNALRRAAAARYGALLAGVAGVRPPAAAAGDEDVWHLYVVQVEQRDRVLAALHEAGIGAGVHYPTPVHRTGAYAHLGLGRGAFPVAEAAADRILSLPMHPHLTAAQQERVVEVLAAAVAAAS